MFALLAEYQTHNRKKKQQEYVEGQTAMWFFLKEYLIYLSEGRKIIISINSIYCIHLVNVGWVPIL